MVMPIVADYLNILVAELVSRNLEQAIKLLERNDVAETKVLLTNLKQHVDNFVCRADKEVGLRELALMNRKRAASQ